MFTLDPDTELDDAFRGLEERDLDRAPVVEPDGRLVGVLSRAVVQRRLAEDEPPEETEA
jgi:CBS domain-containing protein